MATFETIGTFETASGDEVQAKIRYYPGRPGHWYLRNGDPGYPAEPDECEVFDPILADGSPYTASDAEIEAWEMRVIENWDDYFTADFD